MQPPRHDARLSGQQAAGAGRPAASPRKG